MTPVYRETRVTLYHADCVEAMAALPEASVDAIVTDPPYGLEFMGKEWDREIPADWIPEALRVLKPGGHLLAFGGTRTFHRLTCALEDAGFEIRDCLMWLYGSGFPKSLDVSKAIDKAAGAERPVVSVERRSDKRGGNYHGAAEQRPPIDWKRTAPATEDARRWQGWGTALKPAWEPIILARKPLSEGNVAANVLRHGTGAINVDGARSGAGGDTARQSGVNGGIIRGGSPLGRWPANVLLDEEAARQLDEQSGERPTPATYTRNVVGHSSPNPMDRDRGTRDMRDVVVGYGDTGASRFFYTSKAGRDDRDGSKHPTVKPTDLMAYLVRLVTPPGGTVLDPFMGSGPTVWAAREYGFRVIGIDREAEYVADTTQRLRQQVLL